MKLPVDTFIENVAEKKVYYFSSNKINTKVPHYYICIKRTIDDILILSCCTSQFDTVRKFVETRSLPFETLVYISDDGSSNPFTKETYFNCNQCQTYTIEEFRYMYENNTIDFVGEISDNHYTQIITGLHASPLVEEEIKDLIPRSI